jgi:transposase
MMKALYIGMDLHSSNVYVGVVDQNGKKITGHRLPCRLKDVLKFLYLYKQEIVEIAVESTFNWYWLVDGMINAGYKVKLANPGAMKQYKGLKHTNDKTDAFFIAELLRLKILPSCHIYPPATRSIRDLLRRRQTFVQQRTTHILSVKSAIMRNCAISVKRSDMVKLKDSDIDMFIPENRTLNFNLKTNLEMINFFDLKIRDIETHLLEKLTGSNEFNLLQSVPGIGKILGMAIALETGAIERFPKVGNYTSYCRCTGSKRTSNDKIKGKNNTKNGNKYLAWALVEAAHQIVLHNKAANRFYQRKKARKNGTLAIKSIAGKLSKAIYYMLKNRELFDINRVFV